MTTDNRTNEQLSGISEQFTEAQIEAAARTLAGETYLTTVDERLWSECDDYTKHRWTRVARLVLKAASRATQGTAPRAESDPYRVVRVLHEHQRDTSVTSRVRCVCGVSCGDRASHRLHQAELIAHLAPAPVLPSSTVDESAASVTSELAYELGVDPEELEEQI